MLCGGCSAAHLRWCNCGCGASWSWSACRMAGLPVRTSTCRSICCCRSHDSFVGRLPPPYCRDLATVKRLSQHGSPSIGDCLCRSRAGLSPGRRIAWWRKAVGVEKCHPPRVHVVVQVHRQRCAAMTNELRALLVDADDWLCVLHRLRIQLKQSVHATAVLLSQCTTSACARALDKFF